MKKALIVLCTALLFLLLPFETSIAKDWNFQTTEDPLKAWKVKFSADLDETTVNVNNIYVLDGQSKHPTQPSVINGNTIQVNPTTPYQVGKTYELVVTTNVKNAKGQALKESVEMAFEVVDSSKIFKTIKEVTNQNITILTIVTNNDVFDVKISSESLKYKGNNTYEHVLIGEKPGSTITIYAYDEDGKRLATEKYTIEQ